MAGKEAEVSKANWLFSAHLSLTQLSQVGYGTVRYTVYSEHVVDMIAARCVPRTMSSAALREEITAPPRSPISAVMTYRFEGGVVVRQDEWHLLED
jgi:hypothetical protein